MGRGSSSSGGGGSFGGGSSRGSSSSGGRGMSRSSSMGHGPRGGHGGGHRHTTVIVGGGHYHNGSGGNVVGIILGIIFVMVGLFATFMGFVTCASSRKYGTVQAECIDNIYSGGWYYTVYDYNVDGKDYTNRSNEGWEFPEDEGNVVTIYYLKSDPNEITEQKPQGVGEGIVIILAGLVFAGFGSIPLVVCIKELKRNKKAAANESTGETSETLKEETHTKCPYCGSRYKKTSDACPKCGASKMD